MTRALEPPQVTPPTEADSEDLTDDEASAATVTTSPQDMAAKVQALVPEGWGVTGQSLRRRKGVLYLRVRVEGPGSESKDLLFNTDWMRD